MMKLEIKFFVFIVILQAGKNFGCRRESHRGGSIKVYCSKMCSIADLPDMGEENGFVDCMKINESNIPTVPNSGFSKFPNITYLSFNSCHISTIEKGAFNGLHKLKRIYIVKNEITRLSSGIYDSLSRLEYLSFFGNKIEYVEIQSLIGLQSLKTLNLKNNNIPRIDFNFFTLSQLEYLDLSGNPLEEFYLPSRLLKLDLSECRLKYSNLSFPLTNIQEVWMNKNEIEILEKPFFWRSNKIQFLNFNDNRILSISKDYFWGSKTLRFLYLRGNNIKILHPSLFIDLKNLETLDLGSNKIDHLSYGTFDSLEKLKFLDISHNELTDLPQYTFHSLANLQELSFENNQIAHFNVEDLVRFLKQLRRVWLDPSPLNCEDAVHIYETFKENRVRIVRTGRHKGKNVRGISCRDEEKVESDAKMKNFFNIFFQYFDENFNSTDAFEILKRYKLSHQNQQVQSNV